MLLFHYEIFASKDASSTIKYFGNFDAAVDFFFVLSGFVIAHSSTDRLSSLGDYRQFIWRRFARIYPLHILTLGITLALAIAAAAVGIKLGSPQRYDLQYIPANLLLVQAWGFSDRLSFNIVSWSISAEWFLYLTFPLLLWLVRAFGYCPSIALVGIWFILIRIIEYQFGLVPWNDRTYQFAMVRATPTFFLGIALWMMWKERFSEWRCKSGIAYAMAASTLPLMWLSVPNELLVAAFAAVILVGAAASPAPSSLSDNWLMRLLGNASYGLYMWHHLIGIVVFSILSPRNMPAIAATAISATIISLVVGIISFKYFENPIKIAIVRFSSWVKP